MSFDLNTYMHALLLDEPFFAALSRKIDKASTTAIPTAAVGVTEGGWFRLSYNPEFMEKLITLAVQDGKDKHSYIKGVLKHEFYHLCFGHLSSRLPEGGMTRLWNVAMDLSINGHIADELPSLACIPGQGKFQAFPVGLTAEAYYKMLLLIPPSQDEDGDGDGSGGGEFDDAESLDSHDWSDSDGASESDQQIASERLKDMVEKAAHEAAEKGWGSVSGSMRQDIIERLATKVDWRAVLRNFVKASQKANRKSTVKRINKRFPYIHAGKRSQRIARVAISIDQSGSVSDSMLAAFFSELDQLAKFAEFVVVPFDTTVDENLVYTWKKGQSREWERVKYGGTCFDAPTRYVNDHNFDGHIVLTDMEAPKPIPSKCKRMWMTNKRGIQYAFKTNERILEVTE